jgi:hypothetical protein
LNAVEDQVRKPREPKIPVKAFGIAEKGVIDSPNRVTQLLL